MAEAAVGDGELTGVHCFVAGGEEEQMADVGGPGDGGALASVGRGPGQLIVGHFFQHAQQRLAAIAKVGEDVSLRRIRGRVGTYLAAEPEELVPTLGLLGDVGTESQSESVVGQGEVGGDPEGVIGFGMDLKEPILASLKAGQEAFGKSA